MPESSTLSRAQRFSGRPLSPLPKPVPPSERSSTAGLSRAAFTPVTAPAVAQAGQPGRPTRISLLDSGVSPGPAAPVAPTVAPQQPPQAPSPAPVPAPAAAPVTAPAAVTAPVSRAARFGAPPRPPADAAVAVPAQALDSFVGVLDRVTVYNDWAVGVARSLEREEIKITGQALVGLAEGGEYEFRGRTTHHAKHGESFAVEIAAPHVSASRKSIEKFLERNFQGLGPKKAAAFVDWRLRQEEATTEEQVNAALEALRQQLLTAPWSVDVSAVSRKAEFQKDESSNALTAFLVRDMATRLTGVAGVREDVLKGLAGWLIAREREDALQRAGADNPIAPGQPVLDPQVLTRAWNRLMLDPYAPIGDVKNYGFGMADLVGGVARIPRDSPQRLRALVRHALKEGCERSGHVFLTAEQLRKSVADVDPRVDAEQAARLGLEAELIVLDEDFGAKRYYSPDLRDCELSLARRVAHLCQPAKPLTPAPEHAIRAKIAEITRQVAPHMTNGLDPSQVDALVGIVTSKIRLHTLTAGPGCGKTALMEILTCLFKSRDFVFCGPTGKSAKVLNNRLSKHGRVAATAHSTLQGASRLDFQVNESDPLHGHILVMDETGMCDNDLADGLLAAVNEDMHVILLGDDDQLPSVGPGRFLKDVLALEMVDHHRLTTTHRNGGGILEAVRQVRDGDIDCTDSEDVEFSHVLGEAEEEFPAVAEQYLQAVQRHGFENVILLIPKRKGKESEPGWNTTYANAQLRQMCNPGGERIPGQSKLHVGDRIIIRANMSVPQAGRGQEEDDTVGTDREGDPGTQERVVNGDTGTIVGWVPYRHKAGQPRKAGAQCLTLALDDGRRVDFPGSALEYLQHSYALSVHSGQGSEYAHVIFVGGRPSRAFMNRPMVYTALSRASGKLQVFSSDTDLRGMAASLPLPRNSALVARVRKELGLPVEAAGEDDPDIEEAQEGEEFEGPGTPVPVAQMSARARRFASMAE